MRVIWCFVFVIAGGFICRDGMNSLRKSHGAFEFYTGPKGRLVIQQGQLNTSSSGGSNTLSIPRKNMFEHPFNHQVACSFVFFFHLYYYYTY